MKTPAEYFRAKLQFEIDVMDVADALDGTGLFLADSLRRASWDHGHTKGSVHLPTAEIPERAPGLIPTGSKVVVYSWGPGWNGSAVAALALAELGYSVREMICGIEYWPRNGLPIETSDGVRPGVPDWRVTARLPVRERP
jgi:rhodanese-related sulfurtransferase